MGISQPRLQQHRLRQVGRLLLHWVHLKLFYIDLPKGAFKILFLRGLLPPRVDLKGFSLQG